MKPALWHYPQISSYSVLLLLGFLFGWWLARSRARSFGVERPHLDNIALMLPLAGLFGARFFAGLFYARLPIWEALKVWQGDGLVFYGGFIFGAGAVLIYALARRLPLVPLLDCLAPSVALGLAFGRIGCFLAGCCWGDACLTSGQAAAIADAEARHRLHTIAAVSPANWPLAVQYPPASDIHAQHVKYGLIEADAPASAPVHPVQLYETALALALCAFLLAASRKRFRPGDLAIALLLGYALIRFGTEFLRADNKLAYWGLTFSQVVSLWIAAFALGCVLLRFLSARFWVRGAATPCKPHPAIG